MEPAAAQMLLTFAGRYCAILGRVGMAHAHFRTATTTGPMPSSAAAQLGLAQSLVALGQPQQALNVVLTYWRGPQPQQQPPPQHPPPQHQQPQQQQALAFTRAQVQLGELLEVLSQGVPQSGVSPLHPPDALLLLVSEHGRRLE